MPGAEYSLGSPHLLILYSCILGPGGGTEKEEKDENEKRKPNIEGDIKTKNKRRSNSRMCLKFLKMGKVVFNEIFPSYF